MIKTIDIENATLEAIYWWNRTEGYYHQYFSKLDEIYKNNELFEFFSSKIFEVFLSEYSIRRNITSGERSSEVFLRELMKSDFFERVKDGDVSVIDEKSLFFKEQSEMTNSRHVRSLLSKASFLINPQDFSLLDNYAKGSLWTIIKFDASVKKKELDSYSVFMKQVDIIIDLNREHFEGLDSSLHRFQGSIASQFFSKKPDALIRRILDKYLWLARATSNGKHINNIPYYKFHGF